MGLGGPQMDFPVEGETDKRIRVRDSLFLIVQGLPGQAGELANGQLVHVLYLSIHEDW